MHLPFKFEDGSIGDDDWKYYNDCTMTEDFGPLKKGEKFHSIGISLYDYECLEVAGEDGETIHDIPLLVTMAPKPKED